MKIFYTVALAIWAFGFAPRIAGAAESRIDGLYVATYGDPAGVPLVFVHGGPGYHSREFEVSTAARVAELGFYVVAYDQRGQGRSEVTAFENFNYTRYADDLLAIVKTLDLKKPVLLASSFGAAVATRFDQIHPGVAKAVVLASGPINFWNLIQDQHANCRARYLATGQNEALAELDRDFAELAKHRKGSRELSGPEQRLDDHSAQGCKILSPSHPTEAALALRAISDANPAPGRPEADVGFMVNESYIYRDETAWVQKNKKRYFGIYGDEDGYFTPKTLNGIQALLGPSHFFLLQGASHGVYQDQQPQFLRALTKIRDHIKAGR